MEYSQTIKIIENRITELESIELRLRSINTPLVECALKHLEIAINYLYLEHLCLKRVIEDKQ